MVSKNSDPEKQYCTSGIEYEGTRASHENPSISVSIYVKSYGFTIHIIAVIV